MRALVVATPGAGHVNPLLPLSAALVARGDEVTFCAAPGARDLVAPTGATFRECGSGEMEWFARLAERTRGAPGDGLAPERINQYFVPRLFAEIAADDMVDDVAAAAREIGPDVVVFESYALCAPAVARLVGARAVHHNIGPAFAAEVVELANDAVSPLWRSLGLDAPRAAGLDDGVTIEVCPPSLGGRGGLWLRPSPPPARERAPRERPLVYVTLGTFFNSATAVFAAALEALADEPVDVVVTTGRAVDPAELPAPANARVEAYVAQAELLPDCAVVVHHGGAGTMFGCLSHGVPQVVLPQGADNFANAGFLAAAGLGLELRPERVSPASIREAVATALADAAMAARARGIAAEVAAMPDADAVAAALSR